MHVQVAEQAYTQAQAMVATQDAGGAQSAGPGPDSAAASQQNPGEVPLCMLCFPSGRLYFSKPCHPAAQMFSSSRCCTKAGHATGPLHPGDPLLGGGVTGVDICCDAAGAPGPGYRSPNEAAWLSDLINGCVSTLLLIHQVSALTLRSAGHISPWSSPASLLTWWPFMA